MGLGRRLKSAAGLILGQCTLEQHTRFIKADISRFKEDLSYPKSKKSSINSVDKWQDFIDTHDITTQHIKRQYAVRQKISILLIIAIIFFLGSTVAIGSIKIGLAGLVTTGLIYFRNGFRLYQLRHRQLCSIKYFLVQASRSFKECLPLSLPKDWKACQNGTEISE